MGNALKYLWRAGKKLDEVEDVASEAMSDSKVILTPAEYGKAVPRVSRLSRLIPCISCLLPCVSRLSRFLPGVSC